MSPATLMLRLCMLLLTTALALPMASGCGGGGGAGAGEVHPPYAAQAQSLDELRSIPDEIQAQVDRVLQPIADTEVVIDQLDSMPRTLGLDATHLRRLAAASLRSETEVTVDLDASTEIRAEVQAVLLDLQRIATGLRQTPARTRSARDTIEALGTRAATVASRLTAELQATLSSPHLTAEAEARLKADLDLVTTLDADIQTIVADAEQTLSTMPSRGEQALTTLTAALSDEA